jgi:hypothetical protein
MAGQRAPGVDLVTGYLTETLDAATVVDGVLMPETATIYTFDFDSSGVWSKTGQALIHNVHEDVTGLEDYPVWCIRRGAKLYLLWIGCQASDVDMS